MWAYLVSHLSLNVAFNVVFIIAFCVALSAIVILYEIEQDYRRKDKLAKKRGK
jgi:hypothetical protein